VFKIKQRARRPEVAVPQQQQPLTKGRRRGIRTSGHHEGGEQPEQPKGICDKARK